jgi:exosortase
MVSSGSSPWKIVLIIAVAAVLVLVYWPALRWMVNSWLSSDYYSHGFLVPLVSAFFIWIKRDQFKNREPSMVGILWLILGAVLYVLGFLWQVRFMVILSLICVLTGLVFAIWGFRTARAFLFPLVFLLFMVPFRFVQDLAYNLQYVSVHWATWLAKAVGLPIQTSGVEIYLADKATFTVGIVCSGINTLVALMALAAVYAYLLQGSVYKRTGLFILAFPLAIAANVLRITSIIAVAYFSSVETATGWYHDISSPIFFFLAFLVLVLIGRALRFRINYDMMKKSGAGTQQPIAKN